jgi:circadian clock protein KaiB
MRDVRRIDATVDVSATRRNDWHAAGGAHYLLRLYIVGQAASCTVAIAATKDICEMHLKDRYDLEVIDLYRQPLMAERDQVIAAPTLVRVLPAPVRRFVGDLSDIDRVLAVLDLKPRQRRSPGVAQA